MATPTDTETKEIMSAIARLESTAAANHAALTQRMEVGFAQIDAKFAQMDTKLAETKAELKTEIQRVEGKTDIKFAELSGDIKALDQRIISVDQKVTALGDRIQGQDTKFWTLVTIILGSLSTVLIKLLVFPAKPPL